MGFYRQTLSGWQTPWLNRELKTGRRNVPRWWIDRNRIAILLVMQTPDRLW
jgi:hypothetical protein